MQMIHQPIHLSEADHLAVSSAVAAAEAQSAGEIVTIIAGESNSFHDVALLWSALVAFLALTVLTLFPGHRPTQAGGPSN